MANPAAVQRTRVLLMATSLRGGGSEHQVVLLARHLPRELFDVHLYLTERTGPLLAELPADVRVHAPPPDQLRGQTSLQRVADRLPGRLLRRHALFFASVVREHRIDAIYDRALHNTMIAGHAAIRRRSEARRVSTIVSPPHLALPMLERRFVAAKRRLLAEAYRRSDAVIAVSDAVADSAAEYYGLPRERIIVIPNPIDVQAVRNAVAGIERAGIERVGIERAGIGEREPPARFELVCVGRMTKEKGQADLLAALRWLAGRLPADAPRVSLRLVGDGPERSGLQRQWAEMVGAAGHLDGHSVEFVGQVTPALGEIARSDGLVLPSHFEGLPNVVLEAFALQRPVVATRSGGTVQLQGQRLQVQRHEPTCFWADPGSPQSLAGALAALLSDPVARARQVDAATRWVETQHGVEVAVGKVAAILHG